MCTVNDRIAQLRKTLNLSMEKFGNQIGIKRGSVNSIEKNVNNPSERTIMLICNTFNVDPIWLKHGIGDMFLEFPKTELDRIVQEFNLDEVDRTFLETYLDATEEERKHIKNFLQTFAKKINKKNEAE